METVEYKGFTINIETDHDPYNPRNWGHDTTMACIHRRYNLGDEQPKDSEDLLEKLSGLHYYDGFSDRLTWEEFESRQCKEIEKNYITLPLYLYEHGGITMSTSRSSCKWDTSHVGIIYISLADARKVYKVKRISPKLRERIINNMISQVETYDDYLTGNVYGYQVEETGDSCWGYFGYDHNKSGLLQEAKSTIDCYIATQQANHWQQIKTWIRNRVPYIYRKQFSLS